MLRVAAWARWAVIASLVGAACGDAEPQKGALQDIGAAIDAGPDSEDGAQLDDAVGDVGLDADPGDAADEADATEDADATDATTPPDVTAPTTPTVLGVTSGGGSVASTSYKLRAVVGTAIPAATRKSSSYTLRVGPAAAP